MNDMLENKMLLEIAAEPQEPEYDKDLDYVAASLADKINDELRRITRSLDKLYRPEQAE